MDRTEPGDEVRWTEQDLGQGLGARLDNGFELSEVGSTDQMYLPVCIVLAVFAVMVCI